MNILDDKENYADIVVDNLYESDDVITSSWSRLPIEDFVYLINKSNSCRVANTLYCSSIAASLDTFDNK